MNPFPNFSQKLVRDHFGEAMRQIVEALRAWRIESASPTIDRSKVASVLKIYACIDRAVSRFQRQTGLRCLPRCGHCCENPQVDATPLELLPLAVDLWRRGIAQDYLGQLGPMAAIERCVFYRTEISPSAGGHCTAYSLRPSICRLFGFSAMTDKHGKNELVTCGLIKEKFSAAYDAMSQKITEGLSVPRMADFSRQIAALDLTWGQDRLPINIAFKEALERVGFEIQIREKNDGYF